jgi:tRNA threonylcarbamoyladenosine biosynthesis protein TsaE
MHSVNDITLQLDDEAATLACGARFARVLVSGLIVYLHGDLGAGKTTFVRGVLHAVGHVGKVKSPTYTLVEPYEVELKVKYNCQLYHFDLYRFTDEEEWDAAGFREYFNPQSICMIEWPEKAVHVLPEPDIHVRLSLYNIRCQENMSHQENIGRQIQFSAGSVLGQQCLNQF